MNIREIAAVMKQDAPFMAFQKTEQKNAALAAVRDALQQRREEIFEANALDLKRAEETGVPVPVQKRLRMDSKKLEDVCSGIDELLKLDDPVGRVGLCRELDEGLVLRRISCPIGVIGVIFEARPDALVQISSLCIKSGNVAVLKGGKETANTNQVLYRVIHEAGTEAGLPEHFLHLAQSHSEIDELLRCDREVDLLIPRGSNAFVRYIMEHTNIPVMGHSDGICHIYVDAKCDFDMALQVIRDAKTQYPVACNAVETILVNRSIAGEFLPALKKEMDDAGVHLNMTREAADLLAARTSCPVNGGEEGAAAVTVIAGEDFRREYSDLQMSVKLVEDTKEAAAHINYYGSHHTDAILTEDDDAAAYFMQMVDSAGVYRNCSTRFADGFRYGFGAEVGISTGKLHARGPVGLEGLVTYKYELTGNGQIVGDYASGRKTFHFREVIL